MTYWEYVASPVPVDKPTAEDVCEHGYVTTNKKGNKVFKAHQPEPSVKQLRKWSEEHKL